MKLARKILIGITGLIVVFSLGLIIRAQIPSQAIIAITGQPGQSFSGMIRSDGRTLPVSGIVPTNFAVSGCSVECRFQKPAAGGELGVCLQVRSLGVNCSAVASKQNAGVGTFFSFLKCGSYTF